MNMTLVPGIFEFTKYTFNREKRLLTFTYTQNFKDRSPLVFTEYLHLPDAPINPAIPPQLLDQLLHNLHLVLGISYYKLYVAKEVTLTKPITEAQASFWNTVYRKGLGEFLYRNNLDPKQVATFPFDPKLTVSSFELEANERVLLGIGGGKDSIVAAELFREQKTTVTALLTETNREDDQSRELIKALKVPSLVLRREIDEQLFEPHQESYNGHIPISAVFAFIGVFMGALYDYKYPVVANEYSSNFGNLEYQGEIINHQWSKSQEFESLFQDYVRMFITPSIIYFSALRPFYEIRIVKTFTKYPAYFQLFSSCNRVHRISRAPGVMEKKWCGECPKCAFIFLLLAAFLPKKTVTDIFEKNLFADATLLPTFRDLLGLGSLKPFECVGTFEESQAALYLSQKHFKNDFIVKTLLPKIENGKELAFRVLKTNPAPRVPARFAFLGMESVLILGYGREGKVTKQYIQKKFPNLKIGVADKNYDPRYLEVQHTYDIAVKTPGIPGRLVTVPYTTATNLFFAAVPKRQIIGVTGSKGKSTTTSLIFSILQTAGKSTCLLGNIGGPMLEALLKPIDPDTMFVLELSSYQLEDLRQSPHIAVITSLFPEHMDYHIGSENYYRAKQNITAFQAKNDYFVFNPSVERLKAWAKESSAVAVPYQKSIPISEKNLPLLGNHNRQNIQAAVTVAKLLAIPDDTVSKALRTFKSLPHRLENIGTYQGITFYDDSISTSPESTIEALKSLPDVETIFLGGEDRGYDFRELEDVILASGIKNVVLFPATGNRIFSKPNALNALSTQSMEQAVKFAFRHTEPGKICLLSTASPSYSLWKDFIEKGNEFTKFVKKYGKNQLTNKKN